MPLPVSRRTFLHVMTTGLTGAALATKSPAFAQDSPRPRLIDTPTLTIGIEESGDVNGFPVFLMHGWPDSVRAWDGVVPALTQAGYRTIVPHLRGFGPTRFREPSAFRGGEQAAIGQDLLDLADALRIQRFAVAGYDWGNRANCIAAALHAERVRCGVFIGGYTIQDTITPSQPGRPDRERALWYQWYLNTARGRAGPEKNRSAFCRLLWEEWSPNWRFSDRTYETTALAFENPDFVDVTVHSYRHRNGGAPGDPRFAERERQLAARPKISVPAIVLHGTSDRVTGAPPPDAADRASFTALVDRRVVEGGHFLPRENPEAVSTAVLEVLRLSAV